MSQPNRDGSVIPVAMRRNGEFFTIHTDHLGTPRMVRDSSNKTVWQLPYSAFGNNRPVGVLSTTTTIGYAITTGVAPLKSTRPSQVLNLRFPGQYADSETGEFYNYFRQYDPKTGRYTQADPIGLEGGANRMNYVDGNAFTGTDPLGLANSAATFWARGKNPPSEPEKPQMCENDHRCENTITVSLGGACEAGDTMCAISMRAAGFKGPFAREYKTYDWKCLLKLGVVGKGAGAIAGNAIVGQAPRAAQALGASAAMLGVVEGGVAIFTSPYATAAGVMVGFALIAKECECNAAR